VDRPGGRPDLARGGNLRILVHQMDVWQHELLRRLQRCRLRGSQPSRDVQRHNTAALRGAALRFMVL